MNGTERDKQMRAIDREIDDFFAAGARLTKAFIRWLASRDDKSGAVEIAPAQGEKFLTLQELAMRLGRNPRTIEEWEKDFGFPSLRAHPNADPLFDWREVLDCMKRHRHQKTNRVERAGNGRIAAQAPRIGTRPETRRS